MKRDVDLIRQLLLEIERGGAEFPPDELGSGDCRHEDRIHYHVRLAIDAGLVKETNRTSGGRPCLRLTCAGHEFLDLCRDDVRWREAKWVVQEHTGGLSLNILRALLTKWAVLDISRTERRRRWRGVYRPYFERTYWGGEPGYREPVYRVDSYRYEREPFASTERWAHHAPDDETLPDEPLAVSLPVNMI